jgi:hypothetical protein
MTLWCFCSEHSFQVERILSVNFWLDSATIILLTSTGYTPFLYESQSRSLAGQPELT